MTLAYRAPVMPVRAARRKCKHGLHVIHRNESVVAKLNPRDYANVREYVSRVRKTV